MGSKVPMNEEIIKLKDLVTITISCLALIISSLVFFRNFFHNNIRFFFKEQTFKKLTSFEIPLFFANVGANGNLLTDVEIISISNENFFSFHFVNKNDDPIVLQRGEVKCLKIRIDMAPKIPSERKINGKLIVKYTYIGNYFLKKRSKSLSFIYHS